MFGVLVVAAAGTPWLDTDDWIRLAACALLRVDDDSQRLRQPAVGRRGPRHAPPACVSSTLTTDRLRISATRRLPGRGDRRLRCAAANRACRTPTSRSPAGGRADLSVVTGESRRAGGDRRRAVAGDRGPGSPAPGPLAATGTFDPLPTVTRTSRRIWARWTANSGIVIGQRYGYLNGRAGNWYTINGRTLPHVPMYVVHRGDVVRTPLCQPAPAVPHPDASARTSFPGRSPATDSQRPAPRGGLTRSRSIRGRNTTVEFRAENPGVWMFHCHNLPHVAQGLMTHLMYDDVSTPFRIGRINARLANSPE